VPVGDVVGTTDSQALSNKTLTSGTNDITARALFTSSGTNSVSTYSATNPTIGQVLTATSATTAVWQTLSSAGIYGSEYESVNSLAPSTTNLPISISLGSVTGGVTKVNYNTAVKPIGNYRVDWYYNWTNDSASRDICVVILVDGVATGNIIGQMRTGLTSNNGGLDTDDFAIATSGNNQRHVCCGYSFITFGASSSHNIRVMFGRSVSGSSRIYKFYLPSIVNYVKLNFP
jgi:hypothetical protein